MPLFQRTIIKKHLLDLNNKEIDDAYNKFTAYFQNPTIQNNIRNSKEEQFQEGFLRELFGNVLNYTLNPNPGFNLTTELKNTTNSKKVDGAVVINDKAVAVIELKGTDTTDLSKIETQAFGYKNNQSECTYVITSNFEKLRFYIDNTIDFEEFNLFTLTREQFNLLFLCLSFKNIKDNVPKRLKLESVSQEDQITKKLYKDYSDFKRALFTNLVELNPEFDKLLLFKKTQKLLDRFLFILFAEDRLLLPTNLIFRINQEWKNLVSARVPVSLYERYKMYFNDLNLGAKVTLPAFGKSTGDAIVAEFEIFAYNGGLFQPDDVLDHVKIDDVLLHSYSEKLSHYDFDSDVDVNILGHIFENSLNEIDEIKAELEGQTVEKTKTKRKKDGVFYTPKYITKYIVDNTVGKLCEEKKVNLDIKDEYYINDKKQQTRTKKALLDKLAEYRKWLLELTICDPACGSGAFLNQALEFLISEHRYVDELQAKLMGDAMILSDVENSILENNIYGVDLNDESVEIAKLSLWLRTAQKGRKLNSLNNNIKCGNSLIDDPNVAGDKAFSWEKEFPEVFAKGGFDVVIGNPPYVPLEELNEQEKNYIRQDFHQLSRKYDTSVVFKLKCLSLLKTNGYLSFVTTVTWQTGENYDGVRKFLFENSNLKEIINLPFNVFAEAYVDTGIFILTKNKFEGEYKILNFDKKVNITNLEGLNFQIVSLEMIDNSSWKIVLNSIAQKILKRSLTNPKSKVFGEISISTQGLSPSRFKLINEYKEGFFPFLVKGQVYQYLFEKEIVAFTSMDEMASLKKFYEASPKILIRRLINRQDRLTVGYNEEKCVFKKDINPFRITVPEIETKYVLAILASKLISYMYVNTSSIATKDDFRQTTLSEIRQLPILIADKDKRSILIDKANIMLELTSEHSSVTEKFTKYITSSIHIEQSNNLKFWPDLEFTNFIKEINKAIKSVNGSSLTKTEEFEWMELFDRNKKKALELKAKIDKTDKEIDQIVYELYGLTEEEIKIVEGV